MKKNTSTASSLTDASIDTGEAAVDAILNFFLKNEIDEDFMELASELPLIKYGVAAYKIKGMFFTTKVGAYIRALRYEKDFDKEKMLKFINEHGSEKVAECVVTQIDRARHISQVAIQANLLKATVLNKISWDRFVSLCDAVEKLSEPDIFSDDGVNSYPGASYVSSGLCYAYTAIENGEYKGMKTAHNGNFYNDFWEFGLKPARDSGDI